MTSNCCNISGLFFVINQLKVKLYTSSLDHMLKGDNCLTFDLNQPLPLCGDIKIEVYNKPMMRKVVNREQCLIVMLIIRVS